MIATTILFILLGIAAATDVWRRRIYNWTTYPGMAAAFACSGAVGLGWRSPEVQTVLGRTSFGESVAGLLVCGSVMLACCVLFNVGGGDVKLIAMLGAFLGPNRGVEAMLWTFVVGGCVGATVLVMRIGPVESLRRVFVHAWSALRVGYISGPTSEEREHLRAPLFLAPCALAAAAIVHSGWG